MTGLRMMMIGASSRPVPLELLAYELGITVEDAHKFCRDLGIVVEKVGGIDCCDLFACEVAWHRRLNPDFFRDLSPDKVVAVVEAIGKLYEGANRAALLERLNELGKAMFPEVRRRKTFRQSQRNHRKETQGKR